MSWYKICHAHYQGVSEGIPLLPPQIKPLWFRFFQIEKNKIKEFCN